MTVTKLSIALAALASFTAAQAYAATGAFSGPYVSLGAGYESTRVHDEAVSASFVSYEQPNASHADPMGQIEAGYAYNVCPKFNLSANVFYNVGDEKTDKIAATFYHDTTKQKLENNVGVSLEPGYYITPQALGYVKLGYARADDEYKRGAFGISLGNQVAGFLYGAGAKYAVTQHIYIGADLTEYNYGHSAESTQLGVIPVNLSSRAQQTVGLVSVGYQFQ